MASRDDDKVMAGLFRRTLAHSSKADGAIAGDDCPPADVLAAYYERSLGEDESVQYDLHFSQCAHCREQLAAMVRAEEVSKPKATWTLLRKPYWLWNPYFLAPALAVLALAVFFGARHSMQTATALRQTNAPLVAMSQPAQPPLQAPAPQPAASNIAPGPPHNAPSSQMQSAPSDSLELDSLAKAKQSPLPAPQSASQNVTVTATPATPRDASLDATESAPLPNTPSDKKVQDLPLNGRNIVKLQPLAPPADAASGSASQNSEAPRSVSQTVEVTAAAPPQAQAEQSAAPVVRALAPPPAPSASAGAGSGVGARGASGAGTVDGVVAGTAAGTNTTAEAVNRSQTQAPAAMSRFATAAKSQAAQVVAGISAQKIFQTPNTNVLWRSADGGFVERSPDGGATWQGQLLPGASGEIDGGSSPTPKICWLVGSGGTIFMTKDAVNWKKIAPPVPADFSAVTAKDASNATVTAVDGRQFQTSDGGKHWKALP